MYPHPVTRFGVKTQGRSFQPAGGVGLQYVSPQGSSPDERAGRTHDRTDGLALNNANVLISLVPAHVPFDSEEACRRANAGNWPQRLAGKRSTRG
ncbi:Uncharacterized protein ALO76_04002 [Pseudomonas syringae pv. coriandricola]|nr:Uncharacterized protein ALO76_04002 [Pseudomonas syringae pv. coriandricola]